MGYLGEQLVSVVEAALGKRGGELDKLGSGEGVLEEVVSEHLGVDLEETGDGSA